jgi:hypothetical protein
VVTPPTELPLKLEKRLSAYLLMPSFFFIVSAFGEQSFDIPLDIPSLDIDARHGSSLDIQAKSAAGPLLVQV